MAAFNLDNVILRLSNDDFFYITGTLQLIVDGLMIVAIIIWNHILGAFPVMYKPIIGTYSVMHIQYYMAYSRMYEFLILSLLTSFYLFFNKKMKFGFLLLAFSLIGIVFRFVYSSIFHIA